MSITNTQDFTVELIENELLGVELVENEILSVDLTQIDVINNTRQFIESLEAHIVTNETPTKLTSRIFQTANDYIAGSLVVYFNGIKEKYVNKLSDNTFSFNLDLIISDTIEVKYFKQS